jgi:O-antigen/teichoic acid export membrane protein
MKGAPLSARASYGRGAAAGAVARGVEAACTLAQLWLFTRILPGPDFGRLAFGLVVVQVLAMLSAAGFGRLTVYKLARSDVAPGIMAGGDVAGAALGWTIAVAAALAAGLWAGAAPAAALLGDDALAGCLRALAWLVPVTAAGETCASWHLARQRVAAASLAGRALPAMLATALLACAWRLEWGAAGVAASLIAGRAAVLAGWWLLHPVSPLRFWAAFDRSDARFALHAAANGLVQAALRQCDVLLLLPLAGPAVTAHYAVAQRLAWAARFGQELLAPVFTSRAGQLLHAGDVALLQREHDLNRAWSAAAALAPAVLLVLLGPALLRAFGAGDAAYPVLLILLADQVLFVGLGMSGILLLMAGRSGWSLGLSAVTLACCAALAALLVPAHGAAGAAIATLSGFLAVKAATAVAAWRLVRVATVDLAAACLAGGAAAALLLAAFGALAPPLAAGACAAALAIVLVQQGAAVRSALRRERACCAC